MHGAFNPFPQITFDYFCWADFHIRQNTVIVKDQLGELATQIRPRCNCRQSIATAITSLVLILTQTFLTPLEIYNYQDLLSNLIKKESNTIVQKKSRWSVTRKKIWQKWIRKMEDGEDIKPQKKLYKCTLYERIP